MSLNWMENHRGPFLLNVVRPARKKGFHTSEWLKGEVERLDVEEEALALLADPRDTITSIHVWSVKEECFVGGFK